MTPVFCHETISKEPDEGLLRGMGGEVDDAIGMEATEYSTAM